jgi:hypothetical protein
MIDVEKFCRIKQLYHDGLRVGRIAEQLHLDAQTVSKWIQRVHRVQAQDIYLDPKRELETKLTVKMLSDDYPAIRAGKALQDSAQREWQTTKIGRNDPCPCGSMGSSKACLSTSLRCGLPNQRNLASLIGGEREFPRIPGALLRNLKV